MSMARKSNSSSCDEVFATKSNVTRSPRMKTLTRAKKEEIEKVKVEIKAQLPALTPVGVRRCRVSHSEAVLLELEEAGFSDAADYLRVLYDCDDKLENLEGKKLKEQRHLVERIRSGLTAAELARRNNKKIERSKALLDTALFFQSLTFEWYWIADKFFQTAVLASIPIREDNGEIVNIIKYIYGKFIFIEMKDPKKARTLLEEARTASEGKTWSASSILKTKPQSLFKECNSILHEVLIALAVESMERDANFALKAALSALDRANDSGNEEYIAKALFEVGRASVSSGNIGDAVHSFSKFLAKARRIPNAEKICDGHRELAFVYKMLKDDESVMKHLNLFKQVAEESDLPHRLAEAHYCLGEFLLDQGRPASATPQLSLAFDLYRNLNMMTETDKARFLAGISRGEEVKVEYLELISKCNETNPEALSKLLEWKNRRVPFWTEISIKNEQLV